MITSSQQQPQLMQQQVPFMRNGMPALHHNAVISGSGGANNSTNLGNAELTGDSLWDSLYNTTIRTLSLDGLELLAKSFDNLDPNHQLYAGIAKRQRKLLEYQSEFRRNLEVFCQRANLNPKMWPSCIRHVKPAPREANTSSSNTSGLDLLSWSAGKKEQGDQQGTPSPSGAQPNQQASDDTVVTGMPTPLTPLPQPQMLSPSASTSTPSEQVAPPKVEQSPKEGENSEVGAQQPAGGDSWSPKRNEEQEQQETNKEKEQDLLSTEIASSSIAEDKDEPVNNAN